MWIKDYDRESAIAYAKKWAYTRNPAYYNFDAIGGDCTNFVSQCIYTGSKIMSCDTYGWYYRNTNDKSPSWTGVEYLYQFLLHNKKLGPFAEEVKEEELEMGDVIQLSFSEDKFTHTLFVVKKDEKSIYTASHTYDSFARDYQSYSFKKVRFLHIKGVRRI